MDAPPPRPDRAHRPGRQGLVELLLVTGFLVVAAAGAVALFGDELRQTFGGRAAQSASRAAPPSAGTAR
jgi:hypothetical protein